MASLDETVMPRRVALALLAFLVLVALAYRYPPDFEARGKDTFYIAGFAETIVVRGHMGWILHPLSTMGLFPASVSSGAPAVFASLSLLADIPVGGSVVLTGLLLAVLATASGFLLGHVVSRRNWVGLGVAAAFGFAPRLVVFTEASGSARVFVLAIFPLVLALLFKAYRTPTHRTSLTVVALSFVALLALFHRSFLLAAFVIGALALVTLSHIPWRAEGLAKLRAPSYLAILGAFVVLPLSGALGSFAPRETDYSAGVLLQGSDLWIYTANLFIDYATSLGLVSAFIPIGLFAVVRQKDWRPSTRFLLALALLYAAVSSSGQYTILVTLPILAIFGILGLAWLPRSPLPRSRTIAVLLACALVGTMASSEFMLERWRAAQADTLYVTGDLVAGATFIHRTDPDGFFVTNDWLSTNYKVWTLSGNPGVSWDLAIPLSAGVISPEELDIRFEPTALSLYIVTSGLQERTHWLTLMTQDPRDPTAQHVVLLYDLRLFLERKGFENPPTVLPSINIIHETQYKVWESTEFAIWTVPRV